MIDTHTIDIDNVRKILNSCPYYDEVINYDFDYSDKLTINLIDWYKELIFASDPNNQKEVDIINKIDTCMYKYVTDSRFRRGLKKIISPEEITFSSSYYIKTLVEKMINYNTDYEIKSILNIQSSKWI